jgi:acetyl-CoA C-acetyltransferase
MVEAFEEALQDAKIEKNQIDAAWFSTCMPEIHTGQSALPCAMTLRLPNIPVTRVENYCASGTEAFRGATYAVAAGASDIALAIGVEKLKDTGYGGLPNPGSNAGSQRWLWGPAMTAPGSFAQLAPAYANKHGVDPKELKLAMAHVSAKSHENGAKNPKAHLRRAVTVDTIMAAPIVAEPLGLFDCCGVSDGSACAIVTSVEKAKEMGFKDPVTVKALQLSLSNGTEIAYDSWDFDHFITTEKAAKRAYAEAGVTNPREEISMMEVHDCFSITELVTYEDLQISPRGGAIKDVLDGFYNADGGLPCQIDGGLKCFGHPIGASGLRMLYEMYLQLHGRAEDRQLPDPKLGLTHNLGGMPFMNVSSVAIIGKYGV